MAKGSLTERGRRLVGGPRWGIRKRGFVPRPLPEPEPTIMVGNTKLTGPEARIYLALTDLKVEFKPQAVLGGGRELGGAIVDFLLPNQGIALEYQGPFHDYQEGGARDLIRIANRLTYGYRMETISQGDLARLHDRLREVIGF